MSIFILAGLLASAAPSPSLPIAVPVQAGLPTPSVSEILPSPAVATSSGVPAHRHTILSAGERRVRAVNLAATLEPASASALNAVQIYPYSEGAVFHVLTAPGQVTDIALQPGETLGAVAAGDTVRWVIGDTSSGSGAGKRTHVLVKPFAAGLATNLIITTDRRIYHLALTSVARTAMVALSWSYPQDALLAFKAAEAQAQMAQPVARGLQIEQLHFDYNISGDRPAWRPLQVFDDRRQTFILFPESLATGEAPPLFLVNAEGIASLVNYRVQGRYYIVDRLFDRAELRLGLKPQAIVRIGRTGVSSPRRRAS